MKRTLLATGLMVLLLCGFAAWIVATEAGLNWALAQAKRVSGVALDYTAARGRLLDSVELEGLQFTHENLQLRVARAQLRWSPLALRARTVSVDALRLSGLRAVYSAPATAPPARNTLPVLPLNVGLRTIQLEDAEVQIHATQKILIDTATVNNVLVLADMSSIALGALDLRAPGTRLTLRGHLSTPGSQTRQLSDYLWNLQWAVDATELSAFASGLAGTLRAHGIVQGALYTPTLKINLDAQNLAFAGRRLRQATAELDLDFANQRPWHIDARAEGLELGAGMQLETLTLLGTGTTETHQIRAAVTGAPVTFAITADGGYAQDGWTGNLHSGEVKHAIFGSWRQQGKAPTHVGAGAARVAAWCWREPRAEGCVDLARDRAGDVSIQARLPRLALDYVATLSKRPDLKLSGDARATVDALWRSDRVERITGEFTIPQANLVYAPAGADATTFAFIDVNADIDGNETGMRAGGQFTLTDWGSFDGEMRLPGWRIGNPLLPDQSIAGRLQFLPADIRDKNIDLPHVTNLAGMVEGSARIAGTLGQPQLNGLVSLEQGSADIPRLGLRLTDTTLRLQGADDGRIQVRGDVTSGGGRIELNGVVDITDRAHYRGELSLRGENFEAARIPKAHVFVSPALTLTLAPRALTTAGTLQIPQADVRLGRLSSALKPSPDVSIVSEDAATTAPAGWQTRTRIAVKLGDEVRVGGFGFDGRVSGVLDIAQDSLDAATAQGRLQTVDAKYEAYGQKLTVDRGQLFYTGGPINNPGIDFEASRKIGDQRVGVLARGTLAAPELSLFSDPSLEDSNTLSYLVLGRPMGSASASDAATLYSAATSLGFAKGSLLAQRIASQFDLLGVRLDTGDTPEDVSVAIERALSPRLYVRYAVGLWDRLNRLNVNYTIAKHWSVEAGTGATSAVDILYSRER